ncbi:hypothetical protein TR2A62_2775 [Thalassobium sp. R2A62]|nr:hypothetical protein TR2A62_2775 [Thalassobium sp. R2A62]
MPQALCYIGSMGVAGRRTCPNALGVDFQEAIRGTRFSKVC